MDSESTGSSANQQQQQAENGEKMTECSICGQIFSDPKMLPCLHTFCLRCLIRYRRDLDQNGEKRSEKAKMPCPLCQRLFVIPDGGLEALSSNSFFGRLAHQRRLSCMLSTSSSFESPDVATDVCMPCAAAGHEAREPAMFICFDCDEKLCSDCEAAHRKQKPSRHHKVEKLTTAAVFRDDPEKLQVIVQRQSSKCDHHPAEQVKLYCSSCYVPVCSQCIEATHGDHSLVKIGAVAEDGRDRLNDGVQRIAGRIAAFRKLLASIASQRSGFLKQIGKAETRIRQTAGEFIRLIESNRDDLLKETEEIKANTLQELEKAGLDIEFGIGTMESFTELATELRDKGTDSDVAFMWDKLDTRRKQLETMHQDVSVCSVKFRSNDINAVKTNLLGQVTILDIDSSDPYVDTPDVVDIIPGSASVAGVTVLGSELYIVRDLSPNLDIYDVKSFSPIRRMKLEGLRKPADIVSCPQNLTLYVSDSVGHVYCLKPHGEELTRWQVEGEPQGLYAAPNGNVFVTCNDSKQVKEYTEDGTLVRSVRFQQDVQSAWQTIPIEAGKFVVCHGFESGKLHRVCYVDQSGRTLRAYGGANGSGPNRLDAPLRMSVDPFGYVFVLDRNNDRVQLLSPNLVHVRDLVSRNLNGIKQPRRFFLDVNSGCLSVGLIDGRVLIFRVLNTD